MANTESKLLSIARLSAKGRLTLPAEYRRTLARMGDPPMVLLQLGDALVIAPCDEALAAVTQRLEVRMETAGSDVEDLIAAAVEARAEIVREEFRDPDGR